MYVLFFYKISKNNLNTFKTLFCLKIPIKYNFKRLQIYTNDILWLSIKRVLE